MIKKIAVISFYVLMPLGIMILLGFAIDTNQTKPCSGFMVTVNNKGEASFIDSAEVVRQVYNIMGPLKGKEMKSISVKRIEELVNAMYYVENSRVYRTVDGHVIADIKQRIPVARIINSMNENYYIDTRGKLMKTTSRYAARVVVVTGFINTRYSPAVDILQLANDDKLSDSEQVLVDLFKLIGHISSNDFLDAWVDQIYVNRQGEFELVPRNGVHTIELGDIENMEAKFEKLMNFYRNGLTHMGWGNYKRINLKYKNQVVCSK
jgi:cell division protein FtsQ